MLDGEGEGGLGVGSNIPVARARNWEVYRWQCQEIVYRVDTKGGKGCLKRPFPLLKDGGKERGERGKGKTSRTKK